MCCRLLCLLLVLAVVGAQEPRIGDPDLVQVEVQTREYYPQADRWAQAGVRGGITDRPLQATVALGDDIQAAIDGAAPGTIALAAGEHVLAAPLRLRDGIVLRGDAAGTVLRYGAEARQAAVVMEGVNGAGLERLTLVYADPEGLATAARASQPLPVNADPSPAAAPPALDLRDAVDSWVSDVRIIDSWSSPLTARGLRHCTLRAVTIDGAIQRGPGQGLVVIADGEALLIAGLRVGGIRHVALSEPLRDSVMIGSSLGVAIRFGSAQAITGNLFEDCHFIFPPGYPWRPFAKGPDGIGPGNLVINCSAYSQGTDAVVAGILMEDGRPYAIQPTVDRGSFNPTTLAYVPARLVAPLQIETRRASPRSQDGEAVTIAALAEAPAGLPVVSLAGGALLHEFVASGPLPVAAFAALDPVAINRQPPAAGTRQDLAGTTVVFALLGEEAKLYPEPPPAAHVQITRGKFGTWLQPPRGASLDVLKAAGGWNQVLVLSCVVRIHAPVTLVPQWREIGTQVRIAIGDTLITAGEPCHLEAGYHPLTVVVRSHRPAPFIRDSRLDLSFTRHEDSGRDRVLVDVPRPTGGTLYHAPQAADPLGPERAAIAAWFAYFSGLRTRPFADLHQGAAALVADHPDTVAARAAQRVLDILASAPYDERSPELEAQQWGALADHYYRQGMMESVWAINRSGLGQRLIRYYPEEVLP